MKTGWLGVTFTALSTLALPANAQTSGSGWTGWMDMRQPECIERARRAVESQGLRVVNVQDDWFVQWEGRGFVGGISCVADDGTKRLVNPNATRLLVNVRVERAAGNTGALRSALAAYMRGETAGGGARPTTTPAARGGATYRRVGDFVLSSRHFLRGIAGARPKDAPSVQTCEALCTGNPDCKGFARRKPQKLAPYCVFYNASRAEAQAARTLVPNRRFDYYERVE